MHEAVSLQYGLTRMSGIYDLRFTIYEGGTGEENGSQRGLGGGKTNVAEKKGCKDKRNRLT